MLPNEEFSVVEKDKKKIVQKEKITELVQIYKNICNKIITNFLAIFLLFHLDPDP